MLLIFYKLILSRQNHLSLGPVGESECPLGEKVTRVVDDEDTVWRPPYPLGLDYFRTRTETKQVDHCYNHWA